MIEGVCMQFSAIIWAIVAIDIVLSIALGIIYRSGERRYMWRTVSNYSFVRAAGGIVVSAVMLTLQRYPSSAMRTVYFVTYYTFYLALAVITFKLYYEVYRKATVAFPGFSQKGRAIFSWIVVIMIALAVMNLGTTNFGQDAIARGAFNIARAMETVSLCVTAFLIYLIRTMGLPWRGKVFGIMGGIFLGGIGGMIQNVQYQLHFALSPAMTLFFQFSGIAGLLVWVGYAFLPEPLPRPVTLPAESPVYRWSQIASALGTKTQVAVPEPQHSFFLADVEKVVDKVFTRHMQETTDSAS